MRYVVTTLLLIAFFAITGPMMAEEYEERSRQAQAARDAEAMAKAQLAFDQRMQERCGGENSSYRHRAKNEYQCLNKQGRVTITIKD